MITHLGTWRQTLVCHNDKLLPVPTSLPVHVAATLMVNPATAYRMMNDFVELKEGIVKYIGCMFVCVCVCVCVCQRRLSFNNRGYNNTEWS